MDIFRSKEDNPARGISGRLLCDLFLLMTILFFVFASLEVRFYRAKTEEDFVKVAASYSKVAACSGVIQPVLSLNIVCDAFVCLEETVSEG